MRRACRYAPDTPRGANPRSPAAYLTHRQVEGAVQNVLEHGNHKLKDETILAKALTAAESVELSLSEDEIEIRRERHAGERIIHVVATHVMVTHSDGWTNTVECSTAYTW